MPPAVRAEWRETQSASAQLAGQFSLAYKTGRLALLEYTRCQDAIGTAQSLLRLGDVSRQLEDFQQALRYYGHPLLLKNCQAEALCGQAMSYRGLGRWKEAVARFNRCLALFRRLKDREGEAYILWALGTTYRFMGLFHEAQQYLEQSLSLYRRQKDPGALAYAQAGLGGTLRMRGLARESGNLYAGAYGIFKKLHDEFGQAYSSCGQGNAWRMQGQWDKALLFMNRAAALYQKLGLHGPLGFVLWSRAQVRLARGKFSEAKKDLVRSQKLFNAVRDNRGLVYCDLGWGEFWRDRDPSKSTSFFKKVSTRAEKYQLPFEKTHAARRLNRADFIASYRRSGVDWTRFKTYLQFP